MPLPPATGLGTEPGQSPPGIPLGRDGAALPAADPDGRVALLLARGAALRADAVAQVQAAAAAAAAVIAAANPAHAAVPRAARRPPALEALDQWNALAPRLKGLCRPEANRAALIGGVETLARDLMELALRAPDTGMFLLLRQEHADPLDNGYTHAVHVGMACALPAWRLGWAQAEVSALVKAALTMNLSTLELQGRMASEQVRVHGRQDARIYRHPHESAKLLLDAGIRDRPWLEAVRDHHERGDGSGYPAGRDGVGRLSQALRLADVFTARLTPRAGRAPMSAQEALRLLRAEGRADTVADTVAQALISEFGNYPPGVLVHLQSGEIGVVVRRGAGGSSAPLVAAITDTRGVPTVDTPRRDTSEPRFAILGPAANRAPLLADLDPERVLA